MCTILHHFKSWLSVIKRDLWKTIWLYERTVFQRRTVYRIVFWMLGYIYIFGFPKKWGYPKMPKRKHGWWTEVAGSPIFKWSQKMLKWETPQETMGPSDPIGAPDHPGSPRPMHCEAGSGSIKITILNYWKGFPLVNCDITIENHHLLLMSKSTIVSTGPFSIAM
jgi:hypothetical protein